MSQRLFNVKKVGLFLDSYSPGIEKRKGEEVKVVKMNFRVAPFDAKLATAVDDGVGEESNLRATLFKLSHPDPKPHLDRVAFSLGCARQNMHVFASPDTQDARLMFDQVRISKVYARTQKDSNGYVLCFTGTHGPVGRDELEFIHDYFLSQRFVTFEEAEPGLEFEADPDDDEGSDADVKARTAIDGRVPPPMWEDDEPAPSTAKPATERAHRKLHSHQSKKKVAGKPKGRRRA